MNINKTVKIFTVILTAAAIFLMFTAGYYYYSLPDRFYVEKNSRLDLSTGLSVIPVPAQSSGQAISGQSSQVCLKLFGLVPVKNVSQTKVDAPLVIPGGEVFGVKLISDGVMVVDMQSGDCAAEKCGIKEGDVIISVDGKKVGTNREIAELIRNSGGETMPVELIRGGEKMTVKLTPCLNDGFYRAGMWVRDSSAGIGTLTFYSPDTGIFGGLGHPVCDPDTGSIVPIKEGKAAEVTIHGFNRSEPGSPGALLGSFAGRGSIGEILDNTECGVFGTLDKPPSDKQAIPLGFRQDIREGEAFIYSTVGDGKPEKISICIEEINLNSTDSKDMVIRITDRKLLDKTGGILQGMSGSPIIQNGKLVGAVTHVFVKNTDMGYGVFADEMYSRAESSCASLSGEAAS